MLMTGAGLQQLRALVPAVRRMADHAACACLRANAAALAAHRPCCQGGYFAMHWARTLTAHARLHQYATWFSAVSCMRMHMPLPLCNSPAARRSAMLPLRPRRKDAIHRACLGVARHPFGHGRTEVSAMSDGAQNNTPPRLPAWAIDIAACETARRPPCPA